jgi:AcrR family transcriptional regulator
MRKLADELGVAAMSLYYYVPNKDELITAMVDIVFAEIELPPIGHDWKPAMRQRALSTPQRAQPPPLGSRPNGIPRDARPREHSSV